MCPWPLGLTYRVSCCPLCAFGRSRGAPLRAFPPARWGFVSLLFLRFFLVSCHYGLGPILAMSTLWLKPFFGERVDFDRPEFFLRLGENQRLRQAAPEPTTHSQQEVERGSGADRSDPQPESQLQ